jgi:hypothetical protein
VISGTPYNVAVEGNFITVRFTSGFGVQTSSAYTFECDDEKETSEAFDMWLGIIHNALEFLSDDADDEVSL